MPAADTRRRSPWDEPEADKTGRLVVRQREPIRERVYRHAVPTQLEVQVHEVGSARPAIAQHRASRDRDRRIEGLVEGISPDAALLGEGDRLKLVREPLEVSIDRREAVRVSNIDAAPVPPVAPADLVDHPVERREHLGVEPTAGHEIEAGVVVTDA